VWGATGSRLTAYRVPTETGDAREILPHFHVIDWTKGTGAEILIGTVGRSGSVSLLSARGRKVARVIAGSYLITVEDRSPEHGFRLIGPRRTPLRVSGKSYVGTVRRRVKLVRGTYRYANGPGSAASQGTFAVT
jgi:hypothetical protein